MPADAQNDDGFKTTWPFRDLPIFRISLLGCRGAGKTWFIGALLEGSGYGHEDGLTIMWMPEASMPARLRKRLGWSKDALKMAQAEAADRQFYAMKDIIRGGGFLPPTLPPDNVKGALRGLFRLNFPDGAACYLEIVDYAGEFLETREANSELINHVREILTDCDGAIVLAETPSGESDLASRANNPMVRLREALDRLCAQGGDSALGNAPIVMAVNKWDRLFEIDPGDPAGEEAKLNSLLNGSQPEWRIHAELRDKLASFAKEAGFRALPVSAFGRFKTISGVLNGVAYTAEAPETYPPQRFNVLQSFAWLTRTIQENHVEAVDDGSAGLKPWRFWQILRSIFIGILGTRAMRQTAKGPLHPKARRLWGGVARIAVAQAGVLALLTAVAPLVAFPVYDAYRFAKIDQVAAAQPERAVLEGHMAYAQSYGEAGSYPRALSHLAIRAPEEARTASEELRREILRHDQRLEMAAYVEDAQAWLDAMRLQTRFELGETLVSPEAAALMPAPPAPLALAYESVGRDQEALYATYLAQRAAVDSFSAQLETAKARGLIAAYRSAGLTAQGQLDAYLQEALAAIARGESLPKGPAVLETPPLWPPDLPPAVLAEEAAVTARALHDEIARFLKESLPRLRAQAAYQSRLRAGDEIITRSKELLARAADVRPDEYGPVLDEIGRLLLPLEAEADHVSAELRDRLAQNGRNLEEMQRQIVGSQGEAFQREILGDADLRFQDGEILEALGLALGLPPEFAARDGWLEDFREKLTAQTQRGLVSELGKAEPNFQGIYADLARLEGSAQLREFLGEDQAAEFSGQINAWLGEARKQEDRHLYRMLLRLWNVWSPGDPVEEVLAEAERYLRLQGPRMAAEAETAHVYAKAAQNSVQVEVSLLDVVARKPCRRHGFRLSAANQSGTRIIPTIHGGNQVNLVFLKLDFPNTRVLNFRASADGEGCMWNSKRHAEGARDYGLRELLSPNVGFRVSGEDLDFDVTIGARLVDPKPVLPQWKE